LTGSAGQYLLERIARSGGRGAGAGCAQIQKSLYKEQEMQICKVIGHIWSTKKEAALEGFKLMLVQEKDRPQGPVFAAADLVGAGTGEEVLVVSGSTARCAARTAQGEVPIDAAIVGIIDTCETEKEK
jgi:ethanolamine utilization protein EutN